MLDRATGNVGSRLADWTRAGEGIYMPGEVCTRSRVSGLGVKSHRAEGRRSYLFERQQISQVAEDHTEYPNILRYIKSIEKSGTD